MDKRLLGQLFRSFLTTGSFAFGGGYAMIPLIRHEVVERRRWLNAEEFLDALAVAQSAPGPLALNVACFIGYRVAGAPGLAAAALGAGLPSFLAALVAAVLYLRFAYHPAVTGFLQGLRPAVLALIAVAAYDLARVALVDKFAGALAAATVLLVAVARVHPGLLLLAGAAAGWALRRR